MNVQVRILKYNNPFSEYHPKDSSQNTLFSVFVFICILIVFIVFNCSEDFIGGLKNVCKGSDNGCYVYNAKIGKNLLKTPKNAAKTYQIIQKYIDDYVGKHPETKVDYIHDESSLIDVANKNDNGVAIVMPTLGKNEIFEFVAEDMVLPRKSFSMGKASEKRYYLEAKRIA